MDSLCFGPCKIWSFRVVHWEIHLDGEEEHLSLLSAVDTNEQLLISKRDSVYIFSNEFDGHNEYN